MTLLNIITAIKKRFPSAEAKEICRLVNELEKQLIDEIFSPIGMDCRTRKLDIKVDMETPLLLEEENISIYVYYICAVLSLQESDSEGYNAYSEFFNESFSRLAVFYRRTNIPVKKTLLTGGI